MKRIVPLLCLAAAVAAQVDHPHRHPPGSAREYSRVLNDPKRDAWQMPRQVIEALNIKPGEVVADVGAGAGYFSRRFALHAAKVYAVDIDAELLRMAAEDAPANVETILAAPDDPRLPERSVDTVFLCNVLHHIANREAYYTKLARALKPGGRIVNIDFHKKPLPVGPPESMKIAEREVVAEFESAGFRLSRNIRLLPYQYFLEFQLK